MHAHAIAARVKDDSRDAPREPTEVRLSDVLTRATAQGGPAKRSTMYVWMRRNFDGLDRRLKEGSLSWEALASAIVEAGLKDAKGKQPTLRGAQNTFYRVRREKRLGREASMPPAKSGAASAKKAGTSKPAPEPTEADLPDDPPPRHGFKPKGPAVLRGAVPKPTETDEDKN